MLDAIVFGTNIHNLNYTLISVIRVVIQICSQR